MAISAEFSDVRYKPGRNLFFSSCTWKNNAATYSPAVDISPYLYKYSDPSGFLPIPLFTHVSVTENRIVNNKHKKYKLKHTFHINYGVFSISLFTVHFGGDIVFSHNTFTALLLSSATSVFERNSSSLFLKNSGLNGGAIAMYGFSTIFVTEDTNIEFNKNTATEYGGGIFHHTIDQHVFISGYTCFLQYSGPHLLPSERNLNIIFSGNIASSGGSSIYADSFKGCVHYCGRKYNSSLLLEELIHCFGNITFLESSPNVSNFESSGSDFEFNDEIKDYNLIPGATRIVNFTVRDEFNQTVNPLMNIGISTAMKNSSLQLSPQYTLHNEITARGYPRDHSTFHFLAHTIGGVYFHFNVTMQECPPGFYFDSVKLICVCSTEFNADGGLYHAILYCNYSSYQARMKRYYWAGYIPPQSKTYKHLYFAPCFPPLCTSAAYLPNSSDNLPSTVCYENREGIMCGKCIDGYSVYYHSPQFKCKRNHMCNIGPVFYIVSELLPVFILFLVIVIFDFNFTSGSTVGFIFFCQYLDKLSVNIDELFLYIRKPYKLFYGIFNFEYFTIDYLSFCLWGNFQILDIICFKYLTVLTAFAMVMVLISLLESNSCKRLLKYRTKLTTKRSFIRGLSAFLVICYSQCTHTSFLILKVTNPSGMNGTTLHKYSYFGGLRFLEGHYLIYALPAMISLIFITILPPLILIIHPLSLHLLALCKLSEHWIVNWLLKITAMNKLIPFLDCFQSCYKDKLRFFAGLYFVYRVAILCSYTFFETYYGYRVSAEIFLVLFLGIHAIVQPYKNQLHNLIDSLVFLNLALINALSIFSNYILEEANHQHYEQNAPLMAVTVIQLVLLYLPMLVSIMCAVIKLYLHCKRRIGHRNYEMIEAE